MGQAGYRFRPFSESVGVNPRSYSRCLQRAICDFGSDHAFGTLNKKLKEHYGITSPSSAARIITEHHAQEITNLGEDIGLPVRYLIDFYPLCEYLSAAAYYCTSGDKDIWLKTQKESLKLSEHSHVLNALRPYLEPSSMDDSQAPVRACYRYIQNRPEQLDYKTAIEQELPITAAAKYTTAKQP